MLDIMLTIGEKILILFLMIGTGYFLSKKKILTHESTSQITDLVLLLATPCLIIITFTRDLGDISWQDMALVAVVSAAVQGLAALLSHLFFRREPADRQKVLRFAMIYGNVGFMGLPLLESVLGNEGVVYASISISVFNLITWTHGVRLMGGSSGRPFWKCLLNPGIIGLSIGLLIFILHIPLPAAALEVLNAFSGLNTPLAMICIGVHISAVSPRNLLTDRSMMLTSLIRLLVIPAILLIPLTLFIHDYAIFAALLLQAGMPVAANTAMFADRYHGDRALASQSVAFSTLLSIVTLPILAAVARMICG